MTRVLMLIRGKYKAPVNCVARSLSEKGVVFHVLKIRKLSYVLGAEVSGVDITKSLTDETFRGIHHAFLEHSILLFRGQSLTREHHVAFSRRFGELDKNDVLRNDAHIRNRDSGFPEISVNNPGPNPKPSDYSGQYWHSDRSNTCTPALASLLRGVEVPPVGGDTMFSNMYLAYESLTAGMKKLIEGLYGVHSPLKAHHTNKSPRVAHSLVKVHPETGRKSLYIGDKVIQLVGMTVEESAPVIHFLCNHAARPQFVYRHRWRQDDLLVWDNRCTNHNAVGDYDKTQTRHMERTTVMGEPSGYVYEGPPQ